MKTKKIILKGQLPENLKVPELDAEENIIINNHVLMAEHLLEIYQLFEVFIFNYNNLSVYYGLKNTDKLERNLITDMEINDDIAINALVISILSSGVTLIEGIENFFKAYNAKSLYEDFKNNYISKKYSEKFHYRLLTKLRNYALHGHLIVSVDENGAYCFDLNHILNVQHFSHNKKFEKELAILCKDVLNEFDTLPLIQFTISIAEYKLTIIEIYVEFLNTIESALDKSLEEVAQLISRDSSIIYKSDDRLNGCIFYGDTYTEVFNPNDKPKEFLVINKVNAMKKLDDERLKFDSLKKSYRAIKELKRTN